MADLSRAILVLTAPRPPKLPPLQASGWDESEHPRDPGGEGGGQFVEKGDPHAYDENPDAKELKRAWNDLYGRSISWELNQMKDAPKPSWAGPRFFGEAYHDSQFTPQQHQAMEHYQGSGYASVNHMLRDPADFDLRLTPQVREARPLVWDMLQAYGTEAEQIKRNVWAQINDLDSSLRPNPVPVTAYRVNQISPSEEATVESVRDVYGEIGPDIVGRTVTDPGFQSTTLDKAWADRRTDSSGGVRVIVHRIRVPAGVPSIYMPAAHPSISFDEEEELTLGRNTPMKAVGYEERPDGTKIIDWEVQGW